MAEEGDHGGGGGDDPRMEILQQYCLKTMKQVCVCVGVWGVWGGRGEGTLSCCTTQSSVTWPEQLPHPFFQDLYIQIPICKQQLHSFSTALQLPSASVQHRVLCGDCAIFRHGNKLGACR